MSSGERLVREWKQQRISRCAPAMSSGERLVSEGWRKRSAHLEILDFIELNRISSLLALECVLYTAQSRTFESQSVLQTVAGPLCVLKVSQSLVKLDL
jgi:hypothetical protein